MHRKHLSEMVLEEPVGWFQAGSILERRPGSQLLLGQSQDHSRYFNLVGVLHFSFLLLILAFFCFFFFRSQPFVLLHLIVVVTLFLFQLPPLLLVASVSLLTFVAPSQVPLTFLKFLWVFSQFLQPQAIAGKPSPATLARTLASLALAALDPATAVAVREQVIIGARLPAPVVSEQLHHYYH